MTTVVNCRCSKYDVYIGRAGKGQSGEFGNPHIIGYCPICKKTHDREDCIDAFKIDFLKRMENDIEFRTKVLALKDKVLGCFCKPAKCHGDIIVTYLNNQ